MDFGIIICLLVIAVNIIESKKFYVNVNNNYDPAIHDGSDWNNAFDTLEAALNASKDSRNNDDIYMMAGVYKPQTENRANCFFVPSGTTIYGGFTAKNQKTLARRPSFSVPYGDSTRVETLVERSGGLDPSTDTILSGDIGTADYISDNCYHVVTYEKVVSFDRVTIMDGNANFDTEEVGTDWDVAMHQYGGGMITADMTMKVELELNQVRFQNNHAKAGGALWFSANPKTSVSVTVSDCIFDANEAENGLYNGGYGGAIYAYFLVDLTIKATSFTNNYAEFRGGVIYLDYGAKLAVTDSWFMNNEARGYGGAIFSEDRNSQTNGTFPIIETSYFSHNQAGQYGGAICWLNFVQGTLYQNNFTSNTADGYGGAIALFNSTATGFYNGYLDAVTNDGQNTFDSNSDDFFNDPNVTEYECYDCDDWPSSVEYDAYWNQMKNIYYSNEEEIGEKAPNAELKYKDGDKNGIHYCFVDWDNTKKSDPTGLDWNNAYTDIQPCLEQLKTTGGGEVWVTGDDEDDVSQNNAKYTPTTVPEWKEDVLGAKIPPMPLTLPVARSFIMYDNIELYGGFEGKEDKREKREPFKYRTFLSGDLNAVAPGKYANQLLMAADNTIIDGFVFIEAGYNTITQGNGRRRRLKNSISELEVLSSKDEFIGTGIYANSTNVLVQNSIFYRLFAKNKGGAVYCIGLDGDAAEPEYKSPTFKNVAFLENRANLRGGAISADVGCDFKCKWCIFRGNECAKKGGAIYLDFASNPKIQTSEFEGNIALESGGCIAADGKSLSVIEDTTFKDNHALWEGACLYSGSGIGKNNAGDRQGYELYAFEPNGFQLTDIFGTGAEANTLLADHAGLGQSDMYGWPMSTFSLGVDSQPPTASPTDAPTNEAAKNAPNFLVFIVDDMVYTETLATKSYSPFFPVPDLPPSSTEEILDIELKNIEDFVNAAIVFPRSYSGPKCSPSRFAVLTGRSPIHSKYARGKSKVASEQSIPGQEGTKVTVPFSRLSATTSDVDNNIPSVLQAAGYYTGMIGKWHLMDKEDYPVQSDPPYCDALNEGSDATIYTECKNVVQQFGFDYVEAYYHSNIVTNTDFTHNPEWMVYHANNFIETARKRKKPFFLYMAPTLTHDPSALDALQSFEVRQTPGADFLPDDKDAEKLIYDYMDDRATVYNNARKWYQYRYGGDMSNIDEDVLNKAAALLWVDQMFGAVIGYLEKKKMFEETMVILINDHGMGAKGLLYEQGTRIMQSVTYPDMLDQKWEKDLWKNTGYVLPPSFITSTKDLAGIIFELSSANPSSDYFYGTWQNWLSDVQDYIKWVHKDTGADFPQPQCCSNRTIDVYNSHALITEDYKYFYRATTEIEPGAEAQMYPHRTDTEQLYSFFDTTSEQTNLVSSIDPTNDTDTNSEIGIALFEFRMQMIDYVVDEACLIEEGVSLVDCLAPEITYIPDGYDYSPRTPSPTSDGYTCDTVFSTFEQKFTLEKSFLSTPEGVRYRRLAEKLFLNDTVDDTLVHRGTQGQSCGDEPDTYDSAVGYTEMEYLYSVDKNMKQLLFKFIVCCDGTFGPAYVLPDGGDISLYSPNEVLHDNYPSAFTVNGGLTDEEGGLTTKGIVVINVLCVICIVCVVIGVAYYLMNQRKLQYEMTIDELNTALAGANGQTKTATQKSAKPAKDPLSKKQKVGIQLAGYNEMESSHTGSSVNQMNAQRSYSESDNDSDIDGGNTNNGKASAGNTGGLSPVPGSPPEVLGNTANANGNTQSQKPY